MQNDFQYSDTELIEKEEGKSGYLLSRSWFNFCFDNPEKIKPLHTALFFLIIEHNNRLGWADNFGFPRDMAMSAVGIKNHSIFYGAMEDLENWGFIKFIERSKNQYSANIISICKKSADNKNVSALDRAMIQHSSKHGSGTIADKVPINKQINNKQINNKTPSNKFEEEKEIFESFLKKYPGTKRTLETEFANFQKKTKDWKEVLPLLENAIEKQTKSREYLKRLGKFVPEWKHLSTWINNRCWEEEGESVKPFKERTDDEHYEEYVSYDSPNSMFRAKNKDELPYRELRDLSMRLENRLSIDPKYK